MLPFGFPKGVEKQPKQYISRVAYAAFAVHIHALYTKSTCIILLSACAVFMQYVVCVSSFSSRSRIHHWE